MKSSFILELFSAPSRAKSAYESSMEQSIAQMRQYEKTIFKHLAKLLEEEHPEPPEVTERLTGLLLTMQQAFMASFRTIHQGLEGHDAHISETQIKKAKRKIFQCKQTIQHEIERLPLSASTKNSVCATLDLVHEASNNLSDTLEQSLRIRHALNFKL